MDDMKKQSILLALDLFIGMLKEENILIGINVDKKDAQESTIAFMDADKAFSGVYDGFSIHPEKINKWFRNGN